MAQITIIGLGPGDPNYLTREAWQIFSTIGDLWLRTVRHPVTVYLPDTVQLHTFDCLYESAATFESVYLEISEQIVALGQEDQGVYYAVPGHPFVGESTVARISHLAQAKSIPMHIVPGLSFIEPMLTALSLDALDGLQIVDALDIVSLYHPPLNPDLPTLIGQVYSRRIASALKLVLMNQYPDEHEVALVDAAGTDARFVKWLPLYEIDWLAATPLTSLYIPALPVASSFEGFQQTIAKLRSPDGCPWDRKQTHKTLRAHLLEETYEVLLAIDADDVEALQEELGDLLLQIVLHTQIAVEDGEFYMADVIATIDEKLKRRHPHVWGEIEVEDADEVIVNWEAIKRRERVAKGTTHRSMLDGLPLALPALTQASEYIKRVRRVGLQWPLATWLQTVIAQALSPNSDYEKVLTNTLNEFQSFLYSQQPELGSEIFGELFLRFIAIAAELNIDLESVLREANARFATRFKYLETYIQQHEIAFESLTPEQIAELWESLNK